MQLIWAGGKNPLTAKSEGKNSLQKCKVHDFTIMCKVIYEQ